MDSLEKVQEQRYDNFEKTSNEMTIVMLFIWSFGNPDPRRNYARASLIWMAISIVLMLIFYGVVFAFFFNSFNSY